MRSFEHECRRCGKTDTVERAEAFRCVKCRALPGKPCVDLRPLQPVPLRRPHPERIQAVRDADEYLLTLTEQVSA